MRAPSSPKYDCIVKGAERAVASAAEELNRLKANPAGFPASLHDGHARHLVQSV